ncbi:unnamed protein product [Arctogadus glacialis]
MTPDRFAIRRRSFGSPANDSPRRLVPVLRGGHLVPQRPDLSTAPPTLGDPVAHKDPQRGERGQPGQRAGPPHAGPVFAGDVSSAVRLMEQLVDILDAQLQERCRGRRTRRDAASTSFTKREKKKNVQGTT